MATKSIDEQVGELAEKMGKQAKGYSILVIVRALEGLKRVVIQTGRVANTK